MSEKTRTTRNPVNPKRSRDDPVGPGSAILFYSSRTDQLGFKLKLNKKGLEG